MKKSAPYSLMFASLTALSGSLLVASPATAVSQDTPPSLKIDSAYQAGVGCPKQSAATAMSPDSKAFTLTFSKFDAEIGEGSKKGRASSSCTASINFTVPQGWQFSVSKVRYRGYAEIGQGSNGYIDTLMYFNGRTPSMMTLHRFEEGFNERFDREVGANVNTNGSRCGGPATLQLTTGITFDKNTPGTPTSYSRVAFDSVDVDAGAELGLQWKKC